jgi:hypothetical protein
MDSIINKAKGAMSGSSGTATGPSTNQGNANTGTNAPGQDYGDKGIFSSLPLYFIPSLTLHQLLSVLDGGGQKAEDPDADADQSSSTNREKHNE